MNPPLQTVAPGLAALMALGAMAPNATAQVELTSNAVVLSGSAANCTRPATVDWDRVRNETDEWRKIQDENIPEDSARYRILHSRMMKKIKAAARAAASTGGYDLVVRSGDISDDKGLPVVDVTQELIRNL